MEKGICSCTLWQLAGIPCVHSVASIISINRKSEEYVSLWFRKAKFQASYSTSIKPLNGSKMWLKSPYLKPRPPKERRMPGRPVLKRKRHPSENEENPSRRKHDPSKIVDGKGSRTMTCTKCQQKGHNQRKCNNERVDPPVKVAKPRGRPKLNIGVPVTSRGERGGRGRRGGGIDEMDAQAAGEDDLRQGIMEQPDETIDVAVDGDLEQPESQFLTSQPNFGDFTEGENF